MRVARDGTKIGILRDVRPAVKMGFQCGRTIHSSIAAIRPIRQTNSAAMGCVSSSLAGVFLTPPIIVNASPTIEKPAANGAKHEHGVEPGERREKYCERNACPRDAKGTADLYQRRGFTPCRENRDGSLLFVHAGL